MKILIVDDDKDIVNLMSIYIKNEGYQAIPAYSGADALTILRNDHHVDLMILDLMMPGINGVQVLKKVRANSNLPVIILSAKATDMDKIRGLIGGADDYVTKPFNPLEVMARIKSVLRRTHHDVPKRSNVIELGTLTINKTSHEVQTIDGTPIHLTALEFSILYLLASHPNHVFSANCIFQKIWGDRADNSSSEAVMVHMSHLRNKIVKATQDDKVIQTVWGVGYKATGE